MSNSVLFYTYYATFNSCFLHEFDFSLVFDELTVGGRSIGLCSQDK